MPRAVKLRERIRLDSRRRLLGLSAATLAISLPLILFTCFVARRAIGWQGLASQQSFMLGGQFFYMTDEGELIWFSFESESNWEMIERYRADGRIVGQFLMGLRFRERIASQSVLGFKSPIDTVSLRIAGDTAIDDGTERRMSEDEIRRVFAVLQRERDQLPVPDDFKDAIGKGLGVQRSVNWFALLGDLIHLTTIAAAVVWPFSVWRALIAPNAEIRSRRLARGLCAHCLYDRAGAREPTCPECGDTPSQGERAAAGMIRRPTAEHHVRSEADDDAAGNKVT